MMRKLFLVILICLFVLFNFTIGYHDVESTGDYNYKHQEPPENVIIRKLSKQNCVEISVNLTKNSNTFLANKNLPIWIAHKNNSNKLQSITKVMNNIGSFFTYQDTKSCSAAVYFSKREQLDGTIDNRYSLYYLPYDIKYKKINPTHDSIIKSELNHENKILSVRISNKTPKRDGIYESLGQKIEMNKWKFVKSLLPFPEIVYIEILVIINYDIVENFENNYEAIVSYILVIFNSVDMLYSEIIKPKIKINIAGIIIGVERKSFLSIDKNCYEDYIVNDEGLNAACVTNLIKDIVNDYDDIITRDSYDVVIFLTDFYLHGHHVDDDGRIITDNVDGYAEIPDDAGYNGYRLSSQDIRVAVVSNHQSIYQSFSTIAHELAHLMNVLHDQGEFRNVDGECVGNLMKTDGSFCTNCLSFSHTTLEQITKFFSSRDGCIFHNKPRSLLKSESAIQLFWNKDKQCQCYGYEYAYDSRTILWSYVKKLFKVEINCDKRLKCLQNKYGFGVTIDDTGYLMDGTPCNGDNKVCWKGKCQQIHDE